MNIGIIGGGRIGGGLARQLAATGHQAMLSFKRDQDGLGASPGRSAPEPARAAHPTPWHSARWCDLGPVERPAAGT